jgi:hypothetical protein
MLAVVMAIGMALGLSPAVPAIGEDEHSDNMSLLANWDDDGEYRQGADLAFWDDLAVLGRWGGLELVDVGDPTDPEPLGSLDCNGSQNDVSVWGDLVFISVDSPMAHDGCDSPAAGQGQVVPGDAWEGIRIIDISDPAEPAQIGTVYTDCGSHTQTLVPDVRHRNRITGQPEPRVLLYSSSYPLGGQGARCNALSHRRISVVEVPLRNPGAARVVSTPDVSPAIGCHDITIFEPRQIAVAACITESQVWDISDPARPFILSHIRNPAMQIHHSSAVAWDGDVMVLGDEKGGAAGAAGCLTGGGAPTGALWFYDISDPVRPQEISWWTPPQNEASTMCTAHNFNVVPVRSEKRILVVSWYHGGTHVLDFTDPTDVEQLGWYKASEGQRGNPWSSYWYNGAIYANNFDAGYVPEVPESRGLDVLSIDHPAVADAITLPRLNPQTQELRPGRGPGGVVRPVDAADRARAAAQPAPAAAPSPPSL